ncbi:hypothetical protein [Altibacter sp. HG106]|uniref:hypothetical protein n=1 Tax=Altibacter sp. HG106 TaxID=3023937 RepID=UPI0023508783|nr:hypothetical protein [Altibacter sp. HG106]MDC7995064.1 hypothetical protein [Altibacter sp. HG106]
MRSIVIMSLLVGSTLLGQEKNDVSITDFNFESTTNPAFTLLEESPTQLNTPTNLRDVAIYLNNGIANTNLAVEINPYWFIAPKKRQSYLRYRGFRWRNTATSEDQTEASFKHDPWVAYETQSSFTVGYVSKKFAGFEDERPVAAVGFRTTLISFYNATRQNKIKEVVQGLRQGVTAAQNVAFKQFLDLNYTELVQPDDRYCNRESSDPLLAPYLEAAKAYRTQFGSPDSAAAILEKYLAERCEIVSAFVNNPKSIKPNFRLDGALAYSWLFAENSIDSATENRFSTWLTADLAIHFSDTNYLHGYAIGKYLDDGFVRDANGAFSSEVFWDVGGKIELETTRLKVGVEYLKRFGVGEQERFVGSISYQLNENLSLVGAFGEDFPTDENLVTLFGINWGIAAGGQTFSQQ